MSSGYVDSFPSGGFQRVRDSVSAQAFAAENQLRQKDIDARASREKAEKDRYHAKWEADRQKTLKDNEPVAVRAFREYHRNPKSRGGISGSVVRYTEARGYRCDNEGYPKAMAELRDSEFMKAYYPERYAQQEHAKADAADLKPLHVAKCTSCRTPFLTDEKLAEHLRNTRPCPRCKSVCSSGGQVHICHAPCPHCVDGDTYNCIAFNQFHRLEEDRVPEVKYEESGEE